MDIKKALETVVNGENLSSAEMRDVMRQIMTGNAGEAQIGGFLIALRMKGETIDEIMGVRHKELAIEGVQFHPESILTQHGHDLLNNFLKA